MLSKTYQFNRPDWNANPRFTALDAGRFPLYHRCGSRYNSVDSDNSYKKKKKKKQKQKQNKTHLQYFIQGTLTDEDVAIYYPI